MEDIILEESYIGEELKTNAPLVLFVDDNCDSCTKLKTVLDRVCEQTNKTYIQVSKAQADEIFNYLNVRNFPTLLFVENNKVKDFLVGYPDGGKESFMRKLITERL